jgi:hypothetical protein
MYGHWSDGAGQPVDVCAPQVLIVGSWGPLDGKVPGPDYLKCLRYRRLKVAANVQALELPEVATQGPVCSANPTKIWHETDWLGSRTDGRCLFALFACLVGLMQG